MSSIYRTNNVNRGGSPRPMGRGRGVPGRPLARHPPGMGNGLNGQAGSQAHSLPPLTSQDFPLMSSSKGETQNIMNFKSTKPVKLENFTPPLKLQRKDPHAPPPTPNPEPTAGPSETVNEEPNRGPKTGADTSLIAPMGGATRNKQMLFKKRTRQIFLAKEDTRKLREEEQKPWVLEDFDNQNGFVGTLEGGQKSDYMLFVFAVRCERPIFYQ
jgi:transcription initiation factor TFIIF subunit alpha